MANTKEKVAIDHMAKQNKRKDLSNEYIYASLGKGKGTEMIKLSKVYIGTKPLGSVLKGLETENKKLNIRLDKSKVVMKEMLDRIVELERKVKKYVG